MYTFSHKFKALLPTNNTYNSPFYFYYSNTPMQSDKCQCQTFFFLNYIYHIKDYLGTVKQKSYLDKHISKEHKNIWSAAKKKINLLNI